LTVDDSIVAVEAGSVVYVPPGCKQSLESSGLAAIEFLCLVDPAWRPEDEEVLE
jgi:mannose-6-phosphate isomerase-like protein (cupin superfamily)